MKQFKHQDKLNEVKNCPSTDLFDRRESTAYRLCKEQDCCNDDFLPSGLSKPKRFNECLENGDHPMACKWLGLSLYEDKEKLKEMASKKLKRNPKFYKNIGANIFEGTLSEEHGVNIKHFDYEKNTHFCFHPYDDVDLSSMFTFTNETVL